MAITLEKAFKKARKAWRADKTDKALKKAFKAAKAAFEASKGDDAAPAATAGKKRKASETEEEEAPAKKAKPSTDLAALKKALKAARKAKKADNTKETRVALKKAKAAVEAAEAAPAAEEEAAEEAAPAEEAADDSMASLKSDKKWAAPGQDEIDMSKQCERLFCGNLSWDIDDDTIKEFFKDAGTINDVYWLEDRDTGKFKGCGFVSFDSVEMATKALELNGTELMGRPIKLDFSPRNRPAGGKGKGSKGKGKGKGKGGKGGGLSEKPEGCTTVFCGNLSFDIDDDAMKKFASDAGCAEVKAIRWLSDRDSGDFKGCGFVEFWETEDVDKLVKKNGEDLLGRNIRLDYGGARKPRENAW